MSSFLDNYSDKICAGRRTDGDPCRHPALHGERFCQYHKVMGKPDINIDNGPSIHAYLPVFNDAVSIQSAIQDVCEMMLHRRIEPKEASILLYAMQVASTNMAHMNGDKGQGKDKDKDKTKNKKKTSAEPSSADALPSNEASAASSATSSSEPQSLPPGTIQACEQGTRQASE